MCKVVWDSQCAAKLKEIPLLINTISRKIGDISHDITSELLERLNKTFFAIQLDEAMDISNESRLLVYVRYCWSGKIIAILFSDQMPGRGTV